MLESYFANGVLQLPHAKRIFNEFRVLKEDAVQNLTRRSDMIGLYLSCSRFSDTTWKLEAVTEAKKMSRDLDDPYLCLLVASRESSILRMKDEILKSDVVLDDAMTNFIRDDSTPDPPSKDIRHNAQAGKLIQSRAQNLIILDELEEAQHELKRWSPVNKVSPSSMEKTVEVTINLTLGRLSKIQGRFEEALSQLNATFQWIEAEDLDVGGWRRVLLATIGETYCELARPTDAESILIPELDFMKLTQSQDISSGLRLQLVLAESYLRIGFYDRSLNTADHVRRVIERSTVHSSITKRFHLRAWTILARIAHMRGQWDEALKCWEESLKILGLLQESSGSSAAIVEFSIADVLRNQNNIIQSTEREASARNHIITGKVRRYHYTGLNSYWQDAIFSKFSANTSSSAAQNVLPSAEMESLKI